MARAKRHQGVRGKRLTVVLAVLLMVAGMLVAGVGTAVASTTGPTLVGIRAASHPGYDRVVFDFVGGLPAERDGTYVPQLIADGSGLPVPIAGRAILRMRFHSAAAHDDAGHPTAPGTVAFALPNVMQLVRAGDYEGYVSYGIGLAAKQAFTVSTLTNPDRVVVDVATVPTVARKVYFLNGPRFSAGTEPYYTPVQRQVLPGSPATGVMDRLFAGPTAAEMAQGLQLQASQATGFTGLSISHYVAKVQLTGGCGGGSTASIAGEIIPTLKQFPTVRWVKIYDPQGRTEQPYGNVDSIPECLEP